MHVLGAVYSVVGVLVFPGLALAGPQRAPEAVQLAGQLLPGAPDWEYVDAFNSDGTLQVAIDPVRHAGKVGRDFDLYVVAHKTLLQWARDPRLIDVGAGVVRATVAPGSILDNIHDIGTGLPTSGGLTTPLDIVLDFDLDRRLGPGDLIDGGYLPGAMSVGPLDQPGPYTVVTAEWSQDYWVTQRIYYPQEALPAGHVPIVVISHGNGHQYTWYDYLGEHLASHGYVVMSHRNNTQPGTFSASQTTLDNVDAFLGNLDVIAGGVLKRALDEENMSWIGHSRGGEGVVIAYDRVFDGSWVPANFEASDVAFISSIAPTIFLGPDGVNPNDAPYHILSGSADGDVTGGEGAGGITQYYRIFLRAQGERFVTYVHGASHNDFNCCGFNDAFGLTGTKIGRPRAQAIAKAYYLALLESQIKGRRVLEEYLVRAPSTFAPQGLQEELVTMQRAATNDPRVFVVDDFQTNPQGDLSSSGGQVRGTVRHAYEGTLEDTNGYYGWVGNNEPMNGMSWVENDSDPDRGAIFDWAEADDGATLDFELVAGARDLTRSDYVQFRACQGTQHPNTEALAQPLSFTVQLVDGAGVVQGFDFVHLGTVSSPYLRNNEGWFNEFQSIRIPLSSLEHDGGMVDLSDIAAIRLRFGPSWGSPVGRVGLDDLVIGRNP